MALTDIVLKYSPALPSNTVVPVVELGLNLPDVVIYQVAATSNVLIVTVIAPPPSVTLLLGLLIIHTLVG